MNGLNKGGVMDDGVKAGGFTMGGIIGGSVRTGNIASYENGTMYLFCQKTAIIAIYYN